MAMQDQKTGSYPSPKMEAVKQTPMTRLSGSVERLRKVASQVTDVATTLCGEQVSGEGRKDRASTGSGVFGSIEEFANSIDDLADDISEQASRISQRI